VTGFAFAQTLRESQDYQRGFSGEPAACSENTVLKISVFRSPQTKYSRSRASGVGQPGKLELINIPQSLLAD